MKYFKYSLLLLIIAFSISCSDDFLEIKPIGIASEETYYDSLSSIDQTVIAAYAQLSARDVWDIHYSLAFGAVPADDSETGGESTSDWPELQNYDRFTHTKNDAIPTETMYRYCYKGLRLANTALEKYAKFPDSPEKLKRSAECKFLRAFYHFSLVQVFGGVPIASSQIDPDEFTTQRSSIKEVFDFCEADLKDAIANLPTRDKLDNPGRASKGAAQALMCRMLMFESGYAENYPGDERFTGCKNRYAEALNYAQAVINDATNYSLVGIDGKRFDSWWGTPEGLAYKTTNPGQQKVGGFRWLFTVDGDNSPEGIFEIQSVKDGKGWGATRGNVLTVYQTARKYYSINSKTGAVEPKDVGGWSFNSPTEYLVNAFRNSDPRESNLHSTPGSEYDDPRFTTTVGRDSDLIRVGVKWVPMFNYNNLPTGMIGRKFEASDEEFKISQPFEGPFNIRLIRLADIILLGAEAAFKTGDQSLALQYVNMVRTRARMSGETNKPENLTAISYEDIIHERRLELALEPHRFFDLVRWGLTDKFLNGINLAAVSDMKVSFVPGKHEFWPLPTTEVQLSKGALKQYPAWQ